MSPVYLNPSPSSSSPIPNFLELKDQVLLAQTHDDYLSCQILDKNPSYYSHESSLPIEFSSHAQDLKVESTLSHKKSNDLGQVLPSSSSFPQINGHDIGFNHGYKPMSNHKELGDKIVIGIMNNSDHKNSKKWKPSKVRIMQKMMATSKQLHKGEDHHSKLQHNLEQGQHKLYKNNNNNNNNGAIRVCSDCRTTTTPLWRSGPQGPKSLCNACGIRQRKARRAAMAAAAATTGFSVDNGIVAPTTPTKVSKHKIHEEMREREVDNHLESHPLPLKKRGKTIDVDKCGFNSSNNKDYVTPNYYYSKKRAYPHDEEEGAILLMALSCGLACSP